MLPRVEFSDHHPLLICPFGVQQPPSKCLFRFESAWILDESYYAMLEHRWDQKNSVVNNLLNV